MCGIVGVSHKDSQAVQDVYTGLMHLQHRGKETAGIASFDDGRIKVKKGKGEVAQIFPDKSSLAQYNGKVAIGQTRYTTTGSSYNARNAQPIVNTFRGEEFCVGHNGNIVNIDSQNCDVLDGASDTFIVGDMINRSNKESFLSAVIEVLQELRGSFNFIFLFDGKIYVAMDRFGFHPMSIGIKDDGYVVASETCAIDHIGAKYLEEVRPGDLIIISEEGMEKHRWIEKEVELKLDIFEFIYFSRPDSYIYGVEVGLARYYMGQNLARQFPIKADLVIPVPDSANEVSLGYYDQIKKVYKDIEFRPWALFRSHYIGRTFIEPIVNNRELVNRQKFNPRKNQLQGKEVIVIDDSIVRSNTSKTICRILKASGVKKIHFLSASPKYYYPDVYGVDTYRHGERLVMREYDGDEKRLAQEIGSEMVGYLDLDFTINSILQAQTEINESSTFSNISFYTGPFTGDYPDGMGCYKTE